MYRVIKAYTDPSKVTDDIYHDTDERHPEIPDCVLGPYRYKSIRGGLVWPTLKFPGYFTIWGRETSKNSHGDYTLKYMVEGESTSSKDLMEKFTDEAMWLKSQICYVQGQDRWRPYWDSFDDYCRKNGIQDLEIKSGPLSDPEFFELGLQTIERRLDEKMFPIVPGTIWAEQLQKISIDNLSENIDEWYAIRAMWGLIAGFQKHKEYRRMTAERCEALRVKYGPPKFIS